VRKVTNPERAAAATKSWARGAAIRGLVAAVLLAGLGAGCWALGSQGEDPARAATAPPPVPPETVGGGAGPSVLQVSSPVQARAAATGSALQSWADGLAGPLDIPARALLGYANGELVLRSEAPRCHLSWVTLAGLGKAGSDHGRIHGGRLDANGLPSRPLGAAPLQGAAGENATDQRSGPLQLAPRQWSAAGRDVPGSAHPDVQDVDDAAIAAGRTLCAGGTDLSAGDSWWKAIARYRDSDLFRQQVLGNAQLYATLSLDPARAAAPSTRAVRFALDQLGLPYVWGGNGPDAGAAGFDCSGLTKAAYDSAGVSLPRTADTQFRATARPVITTEPALGDLVFYGNPSTRIHHVGLYLGNGMMINAPTQGQAIQIHTYHSKGDDYTGAGRPA
jgi:cell wall-associated NlpC family hydrolase